MTTQTTLPMTTPAEDQSPASDLAGDSPAKPAFIEPKLTWIEPQLVQQGTLTAVAQTGGFFGSFSP